MFEEEQEQEEQEDSLLCKLKSGAFIFFGVGIGVTFLYILFFPLALYYGWALSILWGWFAVPLGMPAIGALEAAAVFSIIRFGVSDLSGATIEKERYKGVVVNLLLAPLLVLLNGKILLALM